MKGFKKLNLKIKKLVNSLFVGTYKTAFKGRGIEFSDYRPYDENDDSKYIDFIASLKEGKLLIKRYQEERELLVFFILDLSESMEFGENKNKIDTLIETFFILSYSGVKNNDKIGAIIFNDDGYNFIKPGKGIKNIYKIIGLIEKRKINKVKGFSVNKLFNIFNNLPIKNNLVFFLSDKMEEIENKNLKISSIKNDFLYINIFDYMENNLIDETGILRLKSNAFTYFINLRNKKKLLKYKKIREQKIDTFKKKLQKFKIDYLVIDNKSNISVELFKFFKAR